MDKNIKEYFERNGIPLTEEKVKEFNEASYNNMISIQKVDYKELLSKYMDLVHEIEHTNFVIYANRTGSSVHFTELELDSLKNVNNEKKESN